MKEYIYSEQDTLFGHREVIGFRDNDFEVKEIDRNTANDIIKKNHYSKTFYNASYIHLGVYINKNLVGVLQYGYAMNPASGPSVVAGTEMDGYLELNRMWLDDIAPRNSESRAIALSIRYIKNKYPKIGWIQSFADERCGCFGIVYQACSFDYFGEHDSVFWELDNEVYHNSLMTRDPNLSKSAKYIQENKERAVSYKLRQFRYIKFLNKNSRENCLLKKREYPKYYENA